MSKYTKEKIDKLIEQWGYASEINMIKDYMCDSIAPGICMNKNCSYTIEVEHDCRQGWCEVCEDNSISSIMILMEVL